MSESVDILIKAEDLATPVIKQSAKAVDGLDAGLKRIKESGGQAKKSADFARIIASSLGGSEIGSYIAQMGEAAQKTSEFAEVQKIGGAGALAFKAGLVSLVGALSFQVGQGLGNLIFQTEKWQKELDGAIAKSKEFASEAMKLSTIRFGESREDIELIRDPDIKKAKYAELLKATDDGIRGVEQGLARSRAEDKEWNEGWLNGTAGQKVAEALVSEGEASLKNLIAQRDELAKLTNERTVANAELKKQNELQDKSEAYVETLRQQLAVLKATNDEKAGVIAAQNTVSVEVQTSGGNAKPQAETDREVATRILKEIDAIAAKAEAEKIAADELRKIETEKENNAKRIIALKENELTKLAEETILLNQGREAANAFALEKQGLAKEDALSIAREREQLDRQKDAIKEAEKQAGKQKPLEAAPINVAVESRLLTRGGGDDPSKVTAKNTADAVKELQQLRKEMLEERRNATKLKVVRS